MYFVVSYRKILKDESKAPVATGRMRTSCVVPHVHGDGGVRHGGGDGGGDGRRSSGDGGDGGVLHPLHAHGNIHHYDVTFSYPPEVKYSQC